MHLFHYYYYYQQAILYFIDPRCCCCLLWLWLYTTVSHQPRVQQQQINQIRELFAHSVHAMRTFVYIVHLIRWYSFVSSSSSTSTVHMATHHMPATNELPIQFNNNYNHSLQWEGYVSGEFWAGEWTWDSPLPGAHHTWTITAAAAGCCCLRQKCATHLKRRQNVSELPLRW